MNFNIPSNFQRSIWKKIKSAYLQLTKLDTVLNDGDRIEIYRPITCDLKTVPRKAKAAVDAAEAE